MSKEEAGFGLRCVVQSHDATLGGDERKLLADCVRTGKGHIIAAINASDKVKATEYLVGELGFDELAVEDALSPNERPAMFEYKTNLFLVVPSISHHDGEETFGEIAVFLGKNYLVAVAYEPVPVLDAWLSRLKQAGKPAESLAFDLHMLLDAVVDGFFPVCDEVEEIVDTLEESVFAGDENIVPEALRLKRRLLSLRQRIAPIRDVVNGLLRRDVAFIPKEVQPYLQDVYDHTLRIAEILDVNRDIIAGVLDAHLAQVSNSLNISMRFLTVMATFLMTASLIAGIYGMNFKYMPELGQRWGYPFAYALMGVLALAEWVYFKRKGWF
jgi:magnesium transporter